VGLRRQRRCFLFTLPCHPTTLCGTPAGSVSSISAPSEATPIVPVAASASSLAVAAPSVGTSPSLRALVPFHEESSLWPYPSAPLDDRDGIVELGFADASALSDVDGFERRRQNGKNGPKLSKKVRAREREEIERSWDLPGDVARNIDVGFSPAILGRPSQAQAHSVGRASGSTASPSRHPQSGPVKTDQPNAVSAPVKIPEPSYTGEPAAASPCGNKSKAKSKSIPNGPNAQVSIPATTQANDAALAKSAASAAIVEAVHGRSNGNGSMGTMDRNEFVREVLTLIHVRCPPSPLWPFIHLFLSFFSWFDPIDRSIFRGSTSDGLLCAGVPYVGALVYLPWRTRCLPAFLPLLLLTSPSFPNPRAPYVATRCQCSCIVTRCSTPALTCIDIRCSVLTCVSVTRVNVCYCERTRTLACGLDVRDDRLNLLITNVFCCSRETVHPPEGRTMFSTVSNACRIALVLLIVSDQRRARSGVDGYYMRYCEIHY
jgi:hypothetical protein